MDKNSYILCVHCYTYNHSRFIVDTMNGFALQQTTFPFVCSIVDDASTDASQLVIKQYVEENCVLEEKSIEQNKDTEDYVLTIARHKDNPNCIFAICNLKYNHHSIKKPKLLYHLKWDSAKYIAFCEGDDYWTCPQKLQEQVSYLENNPDVGLCYAKCRYYYQDKNVFSQKTWGGPSITLKDLIKKNTIPTLSVVCRTELYKQYIKQTRPLDWLLGDFPIWLFFAAESKVFFQDAVIGVYRVLNESASHTSSMEKKLKFSMSQVDIMEYYDNKYEVGYGHDYFERVRDVLKLRTYAIYKQVRLYYKEIKRIRNERRKTIGLSHYKYLLFFAFPCLANKRK